MRKEMISTLLFDALDRFYPDTVNIQAAIVTQDGYGGTVETWADISGLTSLPCAIAPATGGEQKRATMTIVVGSHVISIAGYYNTIAEHDRAVISGVNYDILLVRLDSHSKMTSIAVQIVT